MCFLNSKNARISKYSCLFYREIIIHNKITPTQVLAEAFIVPRLARYTPRRIVVAAIIPAHSLQLRDSLILSVADAIPELKDLHLSSLKIFSIRQQI